MGRDFRTIAFSFDTELGTSRAGDEYSKAVVQYAEVPAKDADADAEYVANVARTYGSGPKPRPVQVEAAAPAPALDRPSLG